MLFVFSVAAWNLPYFFWHHVVDRELSIIWLRFLMLFVPFNTVTFLHFVVALLGKYEAHKKFLKASYALFFLFSLTVPTTLFIKDVGPISDFLYWPQPGIIFHPFLVIWCAYLLYGSFLLLSAFRQKDIDKVKQAQIKYTLIGLLPAFFAGCTNWLLWYGIPAPLLNIAIPFYVIMLGYATLKHNLFNIRVLTTELLTFLIWGFLLVRLITDGYSIKVLLPNLALFVAVIIIGIFLIRAGLHEAKLNSQLDDLNHNLQKKVAEQTKEIRTAYEVEKTARVELQKLDDAKDEFILASQHNLRTPLTITKGYVDEIGVETEKLGNVKLKTFIDKTKNSLDILAQLVNGLIDVTDLKVGKEGFTHDKKP
jgi:signal transduction histidine kinase